MTDLPDPYPFLRPLLFQLDPETAHGLAFLMGRMAQRLRGSHVVQRRDRIEEPNVMAKAPLIQITEVRIERIIVENHIFIGIARV